MARVGKTTFTSESVCAGHPDKVCDRVSDAVVDAVLTHDPYGRVAVETFATLNRLIVGGEVTTTKAIDYEQIARKTIRRLGYIRPELNFTDQSPVEVYVHEQSREIAVGVDSEGAGDQGMMYGFANRHTPELMPLPITLAHRLAQAIDEAREKRVLPYLRPDGKTQVTVGLDGAGNPVSVEHVVVAVPHDEKVDLATVKQDLYKHVVVPVLEQYHHAISLKQLIVNGTGVWHIGGPASDTGMTGRKIVVDTYGGWARVGGGAFSGKDPTKVDRSGAYAARYIAKNLVAHQLCDAAEVRLAYFIGAKKPLEFVVEDFGTLKVSKRVLASFLDKILDTSVQGILAGLTLRRPLYEATAAYGHFGREKFPWEEIAQI